MIETLRHISGDFVVLDLGSANANVLFHPHPDLAAAITLVEIDALSPQSRSRLTFNRRICLDRAVAGQAGKRRFKSRRFPECSSFLDPWPDLVQAYGLERYFEPVREMDLDCATVSELLQAQGIRRVDWFKTDLEGLDFEVLQGANELVRHALCVQSELRFQPFYQGEPAFHEVAAYLAALGFELIWLRPEVWKYATPNRRRAREGRLVYADALFYLSHRRVKELFGESAWRAFAKQIILAKLQNMHNLCEFIYDQTRLEFPPAIGEELRRFAGSGFGWPSLVLGQIARSRFGCRVLGACRRLLGYGYSLTALFPDEVLGVMRPK